MIIKTLVENTALNDKFRARHGLSFYIETGRHKILFDVGEDDVFLHNADLLDVDIQKVDTVVISHAHRDHGGALNLFLERNDIATVYLQKKAFEAYYAIAGELEFDLSLNRKLKTHPQIKLLGDVTQIDEELSIFSDITGRKLTSKLNSCLFKKMGQQVVQDEFEHEQCLVVKEKNKKILFGGCAHNGIINILEKAEELHQAEFDAVFSGFHLADPITGVSEAPELITAIGQELLKRKTVFYTGHCTGLNVYRDLKQMLGDNIHYAAAGSEVVI